MGIKAIGTDPTGSRIVLVQTDIIKSYHPVPSQNSADNVLMRDVLGNKTDGHIGDSAYGKIKKIDEHLHNITELYPVLAAPIVLEKAAGAYAAFPTPTEIIPAGIIGLDFDLHWAVVSAISANGDFVLRLYQGLAGVETIIATKSVVRNAVQSQEGSLALITPLMAAGVRISGAVSSENAALDTLAIKVEYHTY